MDAAREKQDLQEKLVRCRILLSEFPEGVTAKNIKDLAAELEQQNGHWRKSNLLLRTKSNGPPKRAVSF
jgi:hypothetical protein